METQVNDFISVLLADDHPKVRQGLRMLLESAGDICVVGEAGNGFEALSLVEELEPEVLVLDMEMPLLDGPAVARHLLSNPGSTRILAVSAYDDHEYIQALLNYGASGYLMKEEALESLIAAVHGVAHGETGWMSPRVAATLAQHRARRSNLDRMTLTWRERQVLQAVLARKSNAEIASDLGVTETVVERHIELLMEKLKARSRHDLAALAESQHLA